MARQSLAAGATALAILAALVVQHLRHGWPFSLHHGFAVENAHVDHEPEPASARPPAPPGIPPRTEIPFDLEHLAPMGVTVARVERGPLETELRAVATIVPDEALVSHPHTRISGWIETLHVRTTGERVQRGAPLVSIFSRELLASQNEYLAALRAAPRPSPSPLARGARERLRVLGMTEAEIRALEERGEARRNVVIVAPRTGVVLHRGVTVGTAVDPSTELFTIADLSRVWAIAEIPESRIPDVHVGTPARIELSGGAGRRIDASVEFVYPTLTERTRTLRVRFVLPNRDGELRPGAFGTAVFSIEPRDALLVPRDAVVETGIHQHVFVVDEEGRAVPRAVTLGSRLDDRIEVTDGLEEGETVVASGVFIIDSESRLRASSGAPHAHGDRPHAPRNAGPEPAAHEGHGGHR